MRAVYLLLVVSSLFGTIQAGKGHPVGYNYCSAGLTRPKQPKPPGYHPPDKPVGKDFPEGKPAPLPSGAGAKPGKSPVVVPPPVTQPAPVTKPTQPDPIVIKPPPQTQPEPVTTPPKKQDPSQQPKPKKLKKEKKPKKAKKPKKQKQCDLWTGENCGNPPPTTRSVTTPSQKSPRNCTVSGTTPSGNGTHPWTPKHKNDKPRLTPVEPSPKQPAPEQPAPKKPKTCKKKKKQQPAPVSGQPVHSGSQSGTSESGHGHQVFTAPPAPVQQQPGQGSGASHPWTQPPTEPHVPEQPTQPVKPAPVAGTSHDQSPTVPPKKACVPKKKAPVQPPVQRPPVVIPPKFENQTKGCNATRSRVTPVPNPGTSGLSPGNGVIVIPGGMAGEGTTTQYSDAGGACACPSGSGVADWQYGMPTKIGTFYSFAGSEALFGAPSLWCGTGCGKCFKLTSLGSAPETQGTGAPVGDSIFAVLTNACPLGDGKWCPKTGDKNPWGSEYHFDILSRTGTFNGVRWDNPRVQFQQIECPSEVLVQTQTCVCKA